MLTSLTALKAAILPAISAEDTQFDTAIELLGRGVAGTFDRMTGRKLRREAEAQSERFGGGHEVLSLARYPVESVSALEFTGAGSESAEDVSTLISRRVDDSGLIYLNDVYGDDRDQFEVTYIGGYWLDLTSDDNTDAAPSGSTKIPDELVEIWILQCQIIAEQLDLFGTKGATMVDGDRPQSRLDPETIMISPLIDTILKSYRRFAF